MNKLIKRLISAVMVCGCIMLSACQKVSDTHISTFTGNGYRIDYDSTWVIEASKNESFDCSFKLAQPEDINDYATIFAIQTIIAENAPAIEQIGEPAAESYKSMKGFNLIENGVCTAGKYDGYRIVVETVNSENMSVKMNQTLVSSEGAVYSLMVTAEESRYDEAMRKAEKLIENFEIL